MSGNSEKRTMNPNDKACGFCSEINRVYSSDSAHAEMRVPDVIGSGLYRKSVLGSGLVLSYVDMRFSRDIEMLGDRHASGDKCGLMFCLHGGMHWQTWVGEHEHQMEAGENFLLTSEGSSGTSNFAEGDRVASLGVSLNESDFAVILRQAGIKQPLQALLPRGGKMRGAKSSLGIKRILSDIVGCRFSGCLRGMYLESKVMELFAVYFDEVLLERGGGRAPGLSGEHVERLRRGKRILDSDIANAPTLAGLARLIGLNEYRLKTGFKELFGMPVHAYVIDKRLEMARLLLEQEKMRVTEAAQLVGYSELGQFAGKFRRKFGVSPSELAKNN